MNLSLKLSFLFFYFLFFNSFCFIFLYSEQESCKVKNKCYAYHTGDFPIILPQLSGPSKDNKTAVFAAL